VLVHGTGSPIVALSVCWSRFAATEGLEQLELRCIANIKHRDALLGRAV